MKRVLLLFLVFGTGWTPLAAAQTRHAASSASNHSELRVVGTGNGMDMVQAVSALFMASRGDVIVSVPPSIHTRGGVRALLDRSAPLARIARPLSAAERNNGLRDIVVARLPAVAFVHPGVQMRSVTSAQLVALFSGEITNWAEIGGPNLRVRVIRRADSDAGLSALRKTMAGWADLAFTSRNRLAETAQEAIDIVGSTPGAISVGTYSRQIEGYLGVLRVDGVHPTDPAYPSWIDLRIAWRNDAVTAPVRAYLDFWSTPQARGLAETFGALPPPD